MKRSSHISICYMMSAFVVMQGFACSAGGSSMGGSAQIRKAAKGAAAETATPSGSPANETPSPETGSSGDVLDPSNSVLEGPALPTPNPAQNPPAAGGTPTPSNEVIDIPSQVSGSYLYCVKDKVEGTSATVLCAVQDKTTNKPIRLAEKYVSHTSGFVKPTVLQVTIRELPTTNWWHAEYKVTGPTPETITAGLAAVKYSFEGTDINNVTESLTQDLADPVRPDLTIQSLKPQTNAEFRCFDLFRLKGDKIVTTPCGARNSAQDWFITADSKISHSSGVCIKFNPVSSLTIEGDCNLSDTPRFDIAGEQIKIRGTNNCVGLINPDLSGVDYVGVVACNTGDITQHWKISPLILP